MMNTEIITYIVTKKEQAKRLDKVLSDNISILSRTKIASLINDNKVKVNEIIAISPSMKVKENDKITLINKPSSNMPQIMPADIKLDILYEDENYLVINKQAGLTVHPGAGNHQDTMVNALVNYYGNNLSLLSGNDRPGIVHRLDKDTSGIIFVAKNDITHRNIAQQIAKKTLQRYYLATCWGVPRPSNGKIETYIARSQHNRKKMAVAKSKGKIAITEYKVKEIFLGGVASLIECKLLTGRTHQIRVHMTHLGHPLIGDQTYGSCHKKNIKNLSSDLQNFLNNFNRQALHSVRAEINCPTNNEIKIYHCPASIDIAELIDKLRNEEAKI